MKIIYSGFNFFRGEMKAVSSTSNFTTLRKLGFSLLFLFLSLEAFAQPYCTPRFNNSNSDRINRVRLAPVPGSNIIDNTSASSGLNGLGYSDYSATTGNVSPGGNYRLTLTVSRSTARTNGYILYIDYNNDGDFSDANETVQSSGLNTNTSQTLNFTIPAAVSFGMKRMRVIMVNSNFADSCANDSVNFGEAEDYSILVGPTLPLAANDNLNVAFNSVAGAANTINTKLNDYIGSSNGTDGNDYSIASSPLTTANGGTVTETVDGSFVYVPATGFIGADSFIYTLCDRANNCVTATVNVLVNSNVSCVPTSNSNTNGQSWNLHYIDRVRVSGLSQSIDNTSGDNSGFGNFIHLPPADLVLGGTYTVQVDAEGPQNSGWAAYIDYNGDGDFFDANENIYTTSSSPATENKPYAIRSFTVPVTAQAGTHVLRVGSRNYWTSTNPCGNIDGQSEEFEDYVVIVKAAVSTLSITGNGVVIANNATTTSSTNFTNFGITDINALPRPRTFVIRNNGTVALTLTSATVTSTAGSFTLPSPPAAGTSIPAGGSLNLIVNFDPSAVGLFIGTISVSSNDVSNPTFNFRVEGEGAQVYLDTDGDGISDNIDIDDDNDGISDVDEQNNCLTNPLSTTAEVIFLNETFGAGTNRVRVNESNPGITTSYCFEDGTAARAADECDVNPDLGDGNYAIHYSVSDNNTATLDRGPTGVDISSWADRVWYFGQDHTPGDVNGRMALFNASFDPGVFYETEIVGTVAGAPIFYEFWALNLDRLDSAFNPGELPRILPNVTVNFYNLDKSVLLFTYNAGDIPRCDSDPTNMCGISEWIRKTTTFTLGQSDFIIQLVNNAPGGLGNDIALDDIRIT